MKALLALLRAGAAADLEMLAKTVARCRGGNAFVVLKDRGGEPRSKSANPQGDDPKSP
jgi:hypothetical protein